MLIGPLVKVTVWYSLGFRLSTPSIPYEHLHAQPVELLTCLLKCDEPVWKRMPLSSSLVHETIYPPPWPLVYTTATPFSLLQSISWYAFCILNAYLPREATRLKKNITIVPRLVETRAQSIVLSACTWYVSLGWRYSVTIVYIETMRRQHFAEVDYQHSPSISAPLTTPMVVSWALIDIIII